jgi:hypothetical protein
MSKTKVFVCKRADCLVDILKRSDASGGGWLSENLCWAGGEY